MSPQNKFALSASSTGSSKKTSDTCSIRADGLCIGSPRLVGGRKAGNFFAPRCTSKKQFANLNYKNEQLRQPPCVVTYISQWVRGPSNVVPFLLHPKSPFVLTAFTTSLVLSNHDVRHVILFWTHWGCYLLAPEITFPSLRLLKPFRRFFACC